MPWGCGRAEHYAEVAQRADTLYQSGGADVLQGLALFDAERRHIEAAFAFLAAQSAHDDLLLDLVDGVADTGNLRFHPRDRIRWLEVQRAVARRLGVKGAEGHALGNLGTAYYALGEICRAIDHYGQHLAIARGMGDRLGESHALGNLGIAYADLGEPRVAIDQHEQNLAIARAIGYRHGVGAALGNLGFAYILLHASKRDFCK
jgi:tetratricopeptide (TPR) repeat protein